MNNKWSSDICGCCADWNSCLLSYFCPCIQYGHNVEAFSKRPCCLPCLLYFLLTIFASSSWIVSTITRGDIRARYQIGGSCILDCCCHVWCRCCALAQEAREIKAKKDFVAVPNQMNQPGMPGKPNN